MKEEDAESDTAACEFSKSREWYGQAAFESVESIRCLLSLWKHDLGLAGLTSYVAFIIDAPINSRFTTSVQLPLPHKPFPQPQNYSRRQLLLD